MSFIAYLYLGSRPEDSDDKPLAAVEGGTLHGQILWMGKVDHKRRVPETSEQPDETEIQSYLALYNAPIRKSQYGTRRRDRPIEDYFRHALGGGMVDFSGTERAVLDRIQRAHRGRQVITLPPGCKFRLLVNPDPHARQVYYISAQSGAGKSYQLGQLAESYRAAFSDRPILLVTDLKEDETLDALPEAARPQRVDLKKLESQPIQDVKECTNMFVMCDDTDTLKDGAAEAVEQLIHTIATKGRHTGSYLAVANHRLTNYNQTKVMLGEATHFIVFPLVTGRKALEYLLRTYASLDSEDIQMLYTLGRWVCVGKSNFPPYLISETTARIQDRVC